MKTSAERTSLITNSVNVCDIQDGNKSKLLGQFLLRGIHEVSEICISNRKCSKSEADLEGLGRITTYLMDRR